LNKEDFLQAQVEQVLLKMDFISQYKSISSSYKERDESFVFENDKIIEIASHIGYRIKYSKAKEFHLQEESSGFVFKFGFTIRFNSFDFGISITNEDKGIQTSAPWGFLVQLISDGREKVSKVAFKNYADIEGILRQAFKIYEDIKKGLLANPA
jgi:hypothetical protein